MKSKLLNISIFFFSMVMLSLDAYSSRIVITTPLSEGEYMDRTDIEEIVISEGCGLTEIPDYAFLGCSSLRKVTLPKGMKKIGFQAFSECAALEEINLPSTLEDIGSNAFAYCERLDNVIFPDGLKHIGHNAFSFCRSLREVRLPDSIEEVESYAFSDCDSLRKVRLPGNDRLLGELMMNCCGALEEIVAPSLKAPEFDCGSFIFDPEDRQAYDRCVLIVPEEGKDSYDVSKSWQMFNKIVTCNQ